MTDNSFGDMTSDGLEATKDTLGGFRIYDTDVYDFTIKMAYAGKSATSNARSITFHLEDEASGSEYRETIWISNKEGLNYKLDEKDPKKKIPQIGFVTVDELCLLATEKPLSAQITEEKIIPLYDFDAQKELPKPVYVVTSLLGQKIKAAVERTKKFKQAKDASGNFVDTKDTKEENQIQKIFHHESKKTVNEYREGKEASFHDQWLAKNKSKTNDRTTKGSRNSGAARPEASGGRQAGAGNSLFDK